VVIDSILNTIAAVVLRHDQVYIISVTRHISSHPRQTLKFQVKAPQNVLLFLLIQHLLWLLAVTDLEGSTYHSHSVTSYRLDWAWQVILSILPPSANF